MRVARDLNSEIGKWVVTRGSGFFAKEQSMSTMVQSWPAKQIWPPTTRF